MMSFKKIIFLVFLASMTCGSSVVAMDLDEQVRQAQLRVRLSELAKEEAENKLKAAQAEAQRKSLVKAQEQKKQTGILTALANKPRPLQGTSTVKVVAHNAKVEGARGLTCLGNFVKGKGWTWK